MSSTSSDRGGSTGPEGPRTARDDPRPPPPDGMLWDLAGEVRVLLTLPAALTMQVAHPAVSAGVDEYSVFRTDPWGRAERSVASVQRWVYGGAEAVEEGRRLRRLHRDIRGVDAHGREYHALTPANYAWVHATGFPVFQHSRRYLGARPYTQDEERQLYAEWLQVGRVLGIQDRDMPQTLEEFWPYYRRMLREEVERTLVVEELVSVGRRVPPPDRGPRPVRVLLRLLWPVLRPAFARFQRFVTIGFMPPDAREAIGLPWSPRQERRLVRLGRVTGALVPRLPERLRFLPPAYAARKAYREGRRA
ncbi:oxygenase MpaB family protein [Streptomyces sp. WMMB 322]|uniref:oxygenase MpaB family protein n=1 Tax=Streptomyces sp. WMMB 322 TaxID=1286821 RepID=UPI00099E8DD4|nr:oxygenase MpaB family protein [Streptomyces sp. WMMB 322]